MKREMNMEQLLHGIKEQLNENLIHIVISNQRKKTDFIKVKVRPIMVQDHLVFQASRQVGPQVIHENYTAEQLLPRIGEWLLQDFKQLELKSKTTTITAMISKKGKATVKIKKETNRSKGTLEHNRKKEYLLEEGVPVPFLIDLGVMTKEGKIVHARYDKFKQMNRFLEFVQDILPALPQDRPITIVDFGCGKSYLTFAMYYYLHEKKGYPVQMIGLDLKKDVIAKCNRLAEQYGYQHLKFLVGDIKDYEELQQVDMVVTLHACDTATDYAIDKAVKWGAKVILSVPCCQHELNGQMQCDKLQPVMQYGLVKERVAALVTDSLRGQLLEYCGYHTQLLEFIDMEHTPKNILIRGMLEKKPKTEKEKQQVWQSYCKCKELLQVQPLLEKLLLDKKEEICK
jgi:SAM-dependent methyltransferase